jgi:preprotein translocase subunit SecB
MRRLNDDKGQVARSGYQLTKLWLQELTFTCNPKFTVTPQGTLPIDQDFTISNQVDTKEKRVAVEVTMRINATREPFPLRLTAKLIGIFSYGGTLSIAPERFGEVNGPAILLPYLREVVSNITGRSVFPPLYIAPLDLLSRVTAKAPKPPTSVPQLARRRS